jgi:hypothetical protein
MRQPGETSGGTDNGRFRAQQYTEVASAIPSPQKEKQTGKISPLYALRRPGTQTLGPLQEMLRATEEIVATFRALSHESGRGRRRSHLGSIHRARSGWDPGLGRAVHDHNPEIGLDADLAREASVRLKVRFLGQPLLL